MTDFAMHLIISMAHIYMLINIDPCRWRFWYLYLFDTDADVSKWASGLFYGLYAYFLYASREV